MLSCPCYNSDESEGWCLETKDFDTCFCEGNPIQCDFFPEVRQNAINSMAKESDDQFVLRSDILRELSEKASELNEKIPEWIIKTIMEEE